MSRYFTSTVAAAALMSVLAAPVLAQPAQHAPEAQATQGQIELPQSLRDAGLTDLTSKPTRHGSRVSGKLPGGAEVGIMLNEQGELRGLRSQGDTPLPQQLVERLVPQAVRSQQIFSEVGQIQAIFVGDRGVMVAGRDAQSKPVRAGFAEDGTLMRFGRGDEDDRGPGMGPDGERHRRGGHDKGDDHGPRHRGDRDHGDRGPRDHDGPRREGRGGPDAGPRDMPPPGERDASEAGQPIAPDAVRANLTEAGYSQIGQILQQGRVTVAQATNPEGEPVLVEIAPNGRVVRELNR